MEPSSAREGAREQLRQALSTTDASEKDFHVRQAIQLLEVEE